MIKQVVTIGCGLLPLFSTLQTIYACTQTISIPGAPRGLTDETAWWRCTDAKSCSSICRVGKSDSKSPCLSSEFTEISPTPFGTNRTACVLRIFKYPNKGELYDNNIKASWTLVACYRLYFLYTVKSVSLDPCGAGRDSVLVSETSTSNGSAIVFNYDTSPGLLNSTVNKYRSGSWINTITFTSDSTCTGSGIEMSYAISGSETDVKFFILDTALLTWEESKIACQKAGGRLAVIQPDEDVASLKALVVRSPLTGMARRPVSHLAWIGFRGFKTPKARKWIDGRLFDWPQSVWLAANPSNDNKPGEVCHEMFSTAISGGLINDLDCYFYVRPSTVCQFGTTGNYTYTYLFKGKTWYQSHQICTNLGGRLPVFDDWLEMAPALTVAAGNQALSFWIGLVVPVVNIWVDGKEVTSDHPLWIPGYPNHDGPCGVFNYNPVLLTNSAGMSDFDCNAQLYPLCETISGQN